MNSLLPDFYRLVDLEPKAEMLALRATAIQSLVEDPAVPDWVGTVRIFLGRSVSADARSAFVGSFRAADPVFPLRGNDAELVVLAGATLYELLQRPGAAADVAAYALVCADAAGKGVRGPIPDVLERARGYLRDVAVAARSEGDQDKIAKVRAGANPVKDLKALTVAPLPADWAATDTQMRETRARINELLTAIKAMHSGLATAINKVAELAAQAATQPNSAAIQALREEADVLWWLFGERSRDLDEAFDQLPDDSIALVAAKELADLTRVVPGPPMARALLSRTLRIAGRPADEETSIQAVVDGSPRAWRERWIGAGSAAIDDLTPVRAAVRRSLEVDDGVDWSAAYDRGSLFPADRPFVRLDLAEQVFHEEMLRRAVLAEEAAR
jgi:hypothetical protein